MRAGGEDAQVEAGKTRVQASCLWNLVSDGLHLSMLHTPLSLADMVFLDVIHP